MDYSFEVTNYEEEMKNYFKGVSGRHIKDTLFITLRNTGSRPWGRLKGYFKCVPEQSNFFFEDTQIPQDVYQNGSLELVLNFPRIEKNSNKGDVFCSIQLIYGNNTSYPKVIRFRKDYDLFGNALVNEQKVEVEEEEEEDLNNKNNIEEEKPVEVKEEKKEEIKEGKKEEKKDIFLPNKIEEELKKKNEEKKVEEKKGNENDIIVKKFRSAFDFSKADYSDEYILDLIIKSKNDFQRAMMLHLEIEDAKKEEKKNKSKTNEGLDQLVAQFRKEYQLSEKDYSNEKLKTVLSKKQGNFENAFEELMSFIE